jgi:hypothetical protein
MGFTDWVNRGLGRGMVMREEPQPLEGTSMDLFNSVLPNFYAEQGLFSFAAGPSMFGTPDLAQKVWVANRCQHMNANQVSTMPVQWHGTPGTDRPLWVTAPDPVMFQNGISDALYCIVDQVYGWGYSLLYVTSDYVDGWARTFTVIPAGACEPEIQEGRRVYRMGDGFLDPARVVQIDRNPTTAAHGTSAIRAYSQLAYGLLAAGNQSMTVQQGGIPQAVLKSQRKLTAEQAAALQTQWTTATTNRNGAPPVLPPELDFEVLSINPSDLALLDTQEFNAKALATAYGVPSVLLNMALQGGLTYQNPGALGEMWWRFELRNTATRIANALSERLLPRGQFVTIDAADTFAELSDLSEENDPTKSADELEPAPPVRLIGGATV